MELSTDEALKVKPNEWLSVSSSAQIPQGTGAKTPKNVEVSESLASPFNGAVTGAVPLDALQAKPDEALSVSSSAQTPQGAGAKAQKKVEVSEVLVRAFGDAETIQAVLARVKEDHYADILERFKVGVSSKLRNAQDTLFQHIPVGRGPTEKAKVSSVGGSAEADSASSSLSSSSESARRVTRFSLAYVRQRLFPVGATRPAKSPQRYL